MRLFVVVLALAVAASTQAMAFGSHGRMTKKAEINEGCAQYYYRGAGGTCVQGDGSRAVPSRSVLDAVRLLARPAIFRGLWRLAKEGWVEFTNGKRPGAVGSYEICRKLPLRLPKLTLILRAMLIP